MAVYEYFCPKCRKEFELMRPMSAAGKPAGCPKCGSKAERLISGFGSKTGSYLQAPEEPFRGKAAVRAPAGKTGAAKAPNGKGKAGKTTRGKARTAAKASAGKARPGRTTGTRKTRQK